MPTKSFPSKVTTYFATNRNQSGKGYGNGFYEGDPRLIRTGNVQVSKDRNGKWVAADPETFEESAGAVPAQDRAAVTWNKLGTDSSFDAMRALGTSGKSSDILVYLHGAANSFKDAAETSAFMGELYSDPGLPICPFFFSYPANGKSDPVNYFADRDDASCSGPAMARSFGKLVSYLAKRSLEERCGQNIHLLAHSLGNFALRKAVETIFGSAAYRPVRLFKSVILAGADDDVDTLDNPSKMRSLTRLADEIVVYYDSSDKLLRLSDAVHMDRLGQKGPQPFPGHHINGCKLSVVDCSRTKFDLDDDRQRHRHFIKSSAVVEDIRAVLGGTDPSGRIPDGGREGHFILQ